MSPPPPAIGRGETTLLGVVLLQLLHARAKATSLELRSFSAADDAERDRLCRLSEDAQANADNLAERAKIIITNQTGVPYDLIAEANL